MEERHDGGIFKSNEILKHNGVRITYMQLEDINRWLVRSHSRDGDEENEGEKAKGAEINMNERSERSRG